jgi:hypothetical protein
MMSLMKRLTILIIVATGGILWAQQSASPSTFTHSPRQTHPIHSLRLATATLS